MIESYSKSNFGFFYYNYNGSGKYFFLNTIKKRGFTGPRFSSLLFCYYITLIGGSISKRSE